MGMDQDKLIRKLNSVGKEMFVRYYGLFKDYSNNNVTKRSAVERLVDDGISNEYGASIRLGNAKAIFEAGDNRDALRIILESQKLSPEVIRAAIEIVKAGS